MESITLVTIDIRHGALDDFDMPPEYLRTVDDFLDHYDNSYWSQRDVERASVTSTPERTDSSEPDSLLDDIHLKNDDLRDIEVIDLTIDSDEDEDKSQIAVNRNDGRLSPKNKGPPSAVSSVPRPIVVQKPLPQLRRKRKMARRKEQNVRDLPDIQISIKVERIDYHGKSFIWERPRRRGDVNSVRHWVGGYLNGKQEMIEGASFCSLLDSITVYVRANSEWPPTQLQWDGKRELFRGEVCESQWLNVQKPVMEGMLSDDGGEHFGFTDVAETND
ncbi:hypothetical protein LZ32DRAFT_663592 [Colletotrichum eremochloae]|nr:hypothetical protein LZ32DRAFT_663592 [Colletotrichum eremochloae]